MSACRGDPPLRHQPLSGEVDGALVVPGAVDVAPKLAVEHSIVQRDEAAALVNSHLGEEGHVVHAAEDAAIGGLGDGQLLAPQVTERVRRKLLLAQLSLDERRDELACRSDNGPIPIMTSDLAFTGKESFLDREVKFARRWLYSKGVFMQEENRNPVDVELENFFNSCRDGQRPKADLEIGMADAVAVILSNMAMDEGRKVYFNEIDKLGRPEAEPVRKTA